MVPFITIYEIACYAHTRLFTGDGYTCYSDSDATTTTDGAPKPQCLIGVCWCSGGWEYRNHACVKQEGEFTTVDYNRDCKLYGERNEIKKKSCIPLINDKSA